MARRRAFWWWLAGVGYNLGAWSMGHVPESVLTPVRSRRMYRRMKLIIALGDGRYGQGDGHGGDGNGGGGDGA